MVTELIPRGSLHRLLRSRHENKYMNLKCEFNDRELLKIEWQIASGMQHLEERKVEAENDLFIVIRFCDLS